MEKREKGKLILSMNIYEMSAATFCQNMKSGEKTVYVIGHNPADADSICSAIALSNLCNMLGVSAQARMASEPDRETTAVFEYLGEEMPEILKDATGQSLILVDHNSCAQAVPGAREAEIVGIYDHHVLSDFTTGKIIPVVILPLGSTGTLVYTMYRQYGAEIDRRTAAIIATAIMSDTNNCRYPSATPLDRYALDESIKIAGIDRSEFNRVRLRGRIDYSGMSDRDVLLSDYRSYEVGGYGVGICYARSVGEENHREVMAHLQAEMQRYYPESGMDLLYVMIHDYDTDRQDILYFGKGAKEAAIQAVGSADGVHITRTPSISRKGDFLPALAKVLEKQT